MTPLPRTVAGVTLALAFLGVAFSQRPAESPPVARAQAPAAPQVVGMAGCAATGCHGRAEVSYKTMPADVWHESFSRWIDRDPHTRAFAVLDSPLGRQIMTKLGTGKKATEDARCVACHSHPALASETALRDDALTRLRADGVSCEACHGNAERWQIAHTQWTNPATRTADLKSHGMTDLNDWSVQAKTCAGCHVGAPADPSQGYPVRDMTHDMIAAGHPRLEFEFVTFHQKLSKHWNPRHRGTPETDPGKHSLLTAWLVGQIVTEQAYCELSLDRLARGQAGDPRSPLPEFADWNCSQCHHQLVPAPWREAAVKAQTPAVRKLGQPAWIGGSAVISHRQDETPQFGQPIAVQREALEKRKATTVFELMQAHGSGWGNPPTSTHRVIKRHLDESPPSVGLNWEESTRTYLALRSLDAALRDTPSPATDEHLAAFRTALWGTAGEPARREKGDQRKPESRWEWEKPGQQRKPVEEVVTNLRKSLSERLQHLPP